MAVLDPDCYGCGGTGRTPRGTRCEHHDPDECEPGICGGRCEYLAVERRIAFADAVQAAVDRTYAGQKATARKSGRNPAYPHVPIIRHPGAWDGAPSRTEQLVGLAYVTRAEAVEAAEKILRGRQIALTRALTEPRKRALREHHGLPREVPS